MKNYMKKQIILTNTLLALLCSLILSTSVLAQVKTWGYNYYGQLGDGTTTNRLPTTIASLTDIVDIHGGRLHTLAIKSNSTVMAWGFNFHGQLGNGTIDNNACKCNPTPGAVLNLTNVVAVSAGESFSLALKSDGSVWEWGSGTGTASLTPEQVGANVTGFNNIIAIDAGEAHNLALKSDGTVWAWGSNASGELGDGTTVGRVSPRQVLALSSNILAVSAGGSYSVALTKTGRVYVWGANSSGQLGNGATGADVLTPTLNSNITGVAQIQAGFAHIAALKTDGTVWAWGYNGNGQIGNGTATTTGCRCIPTPAQSAVTGVTAIRAENSSHTLARSITGSIRAWGYNEYGQIGDYTGSNQTIMGSPTPVQAPVGSGNVIFGTGGDHSLLSVPTIYAPNSQPFSFRFGDGSVFFTFVAVAGNTSVTAIDPNSTGLTVPAGFTIAENNQAYNISTTAVTSGGIIVCLNVSNEFDQTEFNKLHLLHGEGATLVDRTIGRDYLRREICTQVTSLSPFVFARESVVTAAGVSVSGRVLKPKARGGVPRAIVMMTDQAGVSRTAKTNSQGYYKFEEVRAGETYIFNVYSSRYQYDSQVVTVTEDLDGLNFAPQLTEYDLTDIHLPQAAPLPNN